MPRAFVAALSGLRGVAALEVALYHAFAAVGVALFCFQGWIGVAVFFALSICLILRRLDANSDLKHYFIRRITRIWPMYWATCLLVFVLSDHSLTHLALNGAFIGIYIPNGQFDSGAKFDPHYVLWSLQVEEAAYVCFPLIHRLARSRQEVLAYALMASSFIFGTVEHFYSHSWLATDQYVLPMTWTCIYGAGLLAYLGKTTTWWVAGASFAASTAVATHVWFVGLILLVPFILKLVSTPPAFLARLPFVVLGEISYGLYLVHGLWIQALGFVGLLPATAMAASMEGTQRHGEIARRLRDSLT